MHGQVPSFLFATSTVVLAIFERKKHILALDTYSREREIIES